MNENSSNRNEGNFEDDSSIEQENSSDDDDEKRKRESREKIIQSIKVSPSDNEVSESEDDREALIPDTEIKEELESDDNDDVSGDQSADDDDLSPSWNGSSSGDDETQKNDATQVKEKLKRKETSPAKSEKRKHSQQSSLSNDDSPSEEDEENETKPVFRPGSGYPVEFKLKVLKYAESHSTSATAEKFGLQPKRVREWKSSRQRIEEDSKAGLKRRHRSDGFTVAQKLRAVALATERSIDEARLLYNVDKCTIGKWKARKAELEARMLKGEANSVRQMGAGRKPRYPEIEESLRDWIVSLRKKNVPVSQKMILRKAKSLIEEDPNIRDIEVPRTWCWVTGFLKRQNLQGVVGLDGNSLQRKNMEESSNKESKRSEISHKQEDNVENSDIQIKKDITDDDSSDGLSSRQSDDDDDNISQLSKSLSDEENEKQVCVKFTDDTKKTAGSKRKKDLSPKPKRPRGRPKMPRRLYTEEGLPDDYTSEEEEGDETKLKPVLKPGSGYPVEFKLKVLKYAENHSSTATAEKFGLQPVRVRDWKRARDRIEEESRGSLKRRQRSDGFTVEEKLQAVAFATERSIDEARLLYNVDRNTIGKWKAKKEQLEARLKRGEGNFIRETGSGRKPRYTQIEESLRDWIVALRLKSVTLNYKMILNKAKNLMEEDPNMRDIEAPRTWSWVTGFLKRQNLHGLLGNTLGHEDPQELLNAELKTGNVQGQNLEIPENPNKRNRRTITLEDKVNIIRRIEQGETQGQVAKSLKVATSTIQTIWSCRNEILHKYVNPKSKTKSDVLVWKAYSSIGSALQDWLEQSTSKFISVNSSTLMEKAIQLSETYRLPQFTAEANQWLKIFCKRHKLFDVLSELKDSNAVVSSTTSSSKVTNNVKSTNDAMNSAESIDHQGHDDFPSEFNFNDFMTSKQSDPQTQLVQTPSQLNSNTNSTLPQQVHSHQPISTIESLHNQRFSMPGGIDRHSIITTADAIKYYSLLRSWIQVNYGPHEDILSNHLAVVENTVLKKGSTDISQAGTYS